MPAITDAKPKRQRGHKDRAGDTRQQAAIRLCYEAVMGQGATPGGQGYAGLVKLVQQHGIPRWERLAEVLRQDGGVPDGADPWLWFVREVRARLNAPWRWDPEEQQRSGSAPARASPRASPHSKTAPVSPDEAFDPEAFKRSGEELPDD